MTNILALEEITNHPFKSLPAICLCEKREFASLLITIFHHCCDHIRQLATLKLGLKRRKKKRSPPRLEVILASWAKMCLTAQDTFARLITRIISSCYGSSTNISCQCWGRVFLVWNSRLFQFSPAAHTFGSLLQNILRV